MINPYVFLWTWPYYQRILLILAPQPIQEREGETLNIYEAMIDEVVASDV